VKIVENLGKLFGEIFKARKNYFFIAKQNTGVINLVEDQLATWKKANYILRRKTIHKKLLGILTSQPKFNLKILKIIKKVMDCDHTSLFLSSHGNCTQVMTCGKEENQDRVLKIVEYSARVNRLLNIKDLSAEPLVNSDMKSDLNSALVVPFKVGTTADIGILLFMRAQKEFVKSDEEFAEEISAELSIYQNFSENKTRFSIELVNIDTELNNLAMYSVPDNVEFDFYELFHEVKVRLGNMLDLSSCTIYIANQSKQQLWTRNSNSASSLLFPHNNETLIGRTYEYGEIISLPDPACFMLNDLKVYEDKYVISLPISSASFKDPVIGVLVCTRKEKSFSDLESWLIEKFTECLAQIYEFIYMNYLPNSENDEDACSMSLAKSPNSMFREVNKEKFSFIPDEPVVQSQTDPYSPLFSLGQLSLPQFEKIKNMLNGSQNNIEHFYASLASVARCCKAGFYLLRNFGRKLENVETQEIFNPTQLMKLCIEQKSQIYIRDGKILFPLTKLEAVIQDKDYFELKTKESIFIQPVYNRFMTVVGLLHLVNVEDLEPEEKFYEALAMVTWLTHTDLESQKWQEAIDETRGKHVLQQWSRYLIQVANATIFKLLLCKNAVYKLANCNDIREIMKICIEVLSAVMDCTHCEIIIETDGSVCRLTKNGYSYLDLNEEQYGKMSKMINIEKITKTQDENINRIYIPIVYHNVNGYLLLERNEDLSKKQFEDYRVKNESTLSELCQKIGEAAFNFPDSLPGNMEALAQCIKLLAMKYRPFALNVVINEAAKHLVDGERARYFEYKDKSLVMPDQGIETEMPRDFRLGEGQGISWHSFTNKKAEIVSDAYCDERFDPSVDKLTGYKTTNLITVPLITEFDQFGVIEVLNKRSGKFNSNDLYLLKKFGELVCMVLEITNTMQITMEERFRLLAISNSMENYILVFNEHRNLIYINKPIDKIFGVTEKEILNLTYFAWLHGNKGLLEDLQAVFENSALTIRKTSQKIKIKKNSHFRNHNHHEGLKAINYRISHLQNFSSECKSGVILIIEDATALENLHNEYKQVQEEIRKYASPIGSETKLQKCINELYFIISQLDNMEMKESLQEVISRLKQGGLKKTKFKITSNEYNAGALSSILDIPQAEQSQPETLTLELTKAPSSYEVIIPLSALRDWDLNAFKIENHFDYVYSMLNDFHLIETFSISQQILSNFLTKIREKCNHWNNPFHNFFHCFNVMHGVYLLLSSTAAGSYFNPWQIYSLLVASICHDVDHRGKGNMFEVHSRSSIATTYHDKSVLEQHHAAITFFTLQEEGCNIFASFPNEVYNQARKFIITSILGTDMSKHLRMLENMNSRFKDLGTKPIGQLEKDYEKFAQLIIHAGDLFHPCKSYRTYEVWSMLVCQEFTDQYEAEVKLGLPITQFMKDLDKPKVYYSNEVGFLSFVVRPLWDCVNLYLSPNIDPLMAKLAENISTMKEKLEEWKKAES
jgi:PAS domain-containing protein